MNDLTEIKKEIPKKVIKENTHKSMRIYNEDTFEINDFLNKINEHKTELCEVYPEAKKIDFQVYADCDDGREYASVNSIDFEFYIHRIETNEEYEKRLQRTLSQRNSAAKKKRISEERSKKREANKKENELAEYERLLKKYGGIK